MFKETLTDFGWSIVELCYLVDPEMDEKSIVNWFILGLKHSIKSRIIAQQFKTFTEVLYAAQEEEKNLENTYFRKSNWSASTSRSNINYNREFVKKRFC